MAYTSANKSLSRLVFPICKKLNTVVASNKTIEVIFKNLKRLEETFILFIKTVIRGASHIAIAIAKNGKEVTR